MSESSSFCTKTHESCFTLLVVLSCSTHNSDEEMSAHLMIQDKRQKKEASSIEDELLGYTLMVSGGRE